MADHFLDLGRSECYLSASAVAPATDSCTVLAAADALDAPAVALLGDPGYYRQFGCELAYPLGIHPPRPQWTEHFQIRPLNAWTNSIQGTFRYAAAFDGL